MLEICEIKTLTEINVSVCTREGWLIFHMPFADVKQIWGPHMSCDTVEIMTLIDVILPDFCPVLLIISLVQKCMHHNV
jgi:hypothetical protein